MALWLPGLGLENGKAKAFVSRPRPGLPRPRPELPRPPFSGLKARPRPRPNIPGLGFTMINLSSKFEVSALMIYNVDHGKWEHPDGKSQKTGPFA